MLNYAHIYLVMLRIMLAYVICQGHGCGYCWDARYK